MGRDNNFKLKMTDPYTPYIIGVNADANTSLILSNTSKGTSLYGITDASGQALFDLANLSSGYDDGDTIEVNQAYGYKLNNGEILTSSSIFLNQVTVSKAKINLTGDYADASIELSADGGSNWESVTNNVENQFTTTGQDLRFRITSSGTVVLTDVKVNYN